jgi:hypothetical protein
LYAEVVPRTFSVVVRQGERLSQLRLFQGEHLPSDAAAAQLDSAKNAGVSAGRNARRANIQNGLRLSVDLAGIDGSPDHRLPREEACAADRSGKIRHYDPRISGIPSAATRAGR